MLVSTTAKTETSKIQTCNENRATRHLSYDRAFQQLRTRTGWGGVRPHEDVCVNFTKAPEHCLSVVHIQEPEVCEQKCSMANADFSGNSVFYCKEKGISVVYSQPTLTRSLPES